MEVALCLAECATIAVRDSSGSIIQRTLPEGKDFTSQLLRDFADLTDADGGSCDIKLLRVTSGPANFTQLRTGLAFMRSISMARKIPVLACSLHESHASLMRDAGDCYAIVLRTGAKHWSVQRFVADTKRDPEPLVFEQELLEGVNRVFADDPETFCSHHNLSSAFALTPMDAKQLFDVSGTQTTYAHLSPVYVRPADAIVSASVLRTSS